jgi:UDP-N-acetylmuramoylalanine--D-glutamate ligase
MIHQNKFHNKKVAIYGMGKTGIASANFLLSINSTVICWDDKKAIRRKLKNSKIFCKKFWTKSSNEVDYIVVSPGIDIKKSKLKNFLKKNKKK